MSELSSDVDLEEPVDFDEIVEVWVEPLSVDVRDGLDASVRVEPCEEVS